MAGRLEGAVALVTGASSGIGEATALALAAEGATVAIAARRRDRLEALAEKIDAQTRALVFETDVTDEAQVVAMVERTVTDLGALDVLVNNAGVMLLGPILDAPTEEWRRMVELNLLGLLYCSHASLRHLLAAAEGDRGVADIVNVSSVAGRVARVGSGVYNATKFAVGAFSESLRQEVTKRHVRVTLVEPGAVATELSSHNRPEVREVIASNFAGVTRLEADDIAAAVLYAVTQPPHVAVNEVLIRPTEQER
jgi:NADP-dependent 3-hydroxy acid dehydrogenase YdfG